MKAREDSPHPEQVLPVDSATIDLCERILHRAGLDSSTGAILSSMRVIPNAAEKRAAKQDSGAIAVDMESAAIAIEAAARGIPFAIVRTVIDSLEDEIFGAEMADEQGRVKPLAAANYLRAQPWRVSQDSVDDSQPRARDPRAGRRYRSAYQNPAAVVLLTLGEWSQWH